MLQVVTITVAGLSTRIDDAEIAAETAIAPRIEKVHLAHVCRKFGVRNRAEPTRTAAPRFKR
jgi:DNA-binding CsgD family transcriptional regulator